MRWRCSFVFLAALGLSVSLSKIATSQTSSSESDLRSAVGNATAGSTITIADGTYDLLDVLSSQAGGTASNPIVIRAQNPHGAIINTNGQQAAFLITHPYWVIE